MKPSGMCKPSRYHGMKSAWAGKIPACRLRRMRKAMAGKINILCYLAALFFAANTAQADRLPVADFSASGLQGWADKVFEGRTAYRLLPLEDQKVLAAESRNSASGLVKKVHVDIRKYPYLNWRWRIENRLDIADETIKSGDDYAARIYVVVDGGILIWRTRAVNYVWASGAAKGDIWENAFAGGNAQMMALRNRRDSLSTWYDERRNVYADLKRLFGNEIRFIDAIAIMTDTDNTHGQVKAYYGDIYFSEE